MDNEIKYKKVPLSDITSPLKYGPLNVYKDCWWVVDTEDNVFFYLGQSYSPQCNKTKTIAEFAAERIGGCHIVFVPWAWVKFSMYDYM